MSKPRQTVWGMGLVVLMGSLLLPATVRAPQASGIAGVVRDAADALHGRVKVRPRTP